ncbi:hypothetical protein GCM10019059_25930 [Camelimonas fluminis]|nr:hypothetical protein GCM10019059_25930 [Camelimonas fluminis]
MLVRDQNIGERPAGLLQRRADRLRFRRIDGRAGAGLPVAHQNADIIGQAGENVEFGWHADLSLVSCALQQQANFRYG